GQGRQEGGDLLRHQIARCREGRSQELTLKVWDPIVRLLHWALAILVVFDLVYDDGGYTHRMVGYAAAAVVLLRLSWVMIARGQGSLMPSVPATLTYLRLLLRGR